MKAKGFNLLRWNKNVDVEFVGRHLLDPLDSTNEKYIDAKIREQIKGSSVTVVLIGRDSYKSEYQPYEVEVSLGKENPSGILGIKLEKDITLPPDSALARSLNDAGAEIIDWEPEEFGDAIERAGLAGGRAARIRTAPPGGTSCIR